MHPPNDSPVFVIDFQGNLAVLNNDNNNNNNNNNINKNVACFRYYNL